MEQLRSSGTNGGCEGDHELAKKCEKELALTVRSVCYIAEDQ